MTTSPAPIDAGVKEVCIYLNRCPTTTFTVTFVEDVAGIAFTTEDALNEFVRVVWDRQERG